MISRYMLLAFVAVVYCFLYIPIILLVVFSFNSNVLGYEWSGFSLQWYKALYTMPELWDALKTSLIVALSTVALSITMGTLLIFYSAKTIFNKLLIVFYANLAVPEIVLSVGLLIIFSFFSLTLGITTLIAGHTILGLGYVVPLLHARFIEIDKRLIEASLDLGATMTQTFFRIILPLLSPAIFSASLLVFIISFDDFILSFFCSGATIQTLPMYIFSMVRTGVSPVINALSTLLLISSSVLVLLFSSLQIKK